MLNKLMFELYCLPLCRCHINFFAKSEIKNSLCLFYNYKFTPHTYCWGKPNILKSSITKIMKPLKYQYYFCKTDIYTILS